MKDKKEKNDYSHTITIIDPATGWIEILSVPDI